ncbi:MAG: hypothetical protein FWG94_11645, partial [Oscillospiraceae bacterium]|nr:hypothetical protein [Oscillospiraceae bacterium]
MMLALFSVMLIYIGSLALEEQRKNDRLILSQIENSIELMHGSVQDACIALFNNYNVVSIMYDRGIESDFGNLMLRMNIINRSVVRTSPFIHSIYIHNGFTDTFYSSFRRLSFSDSDLLRMLEANGAPPRLTPIHRFIDEPEFSGDVLTYFHYGGLDEHMRMDGGIVANIRIEWLLHNIKRAGSPDGEDNATVILVTDSGRMISDDSVSAPLKDLTAEYYMRHIKPLMGEESFFQAELGGVAYSISYLPIS